MPIAKVRLPTGQIMELKVAEGTTPEQIKAFVTRRLADSRSQAARQVAGDPITAAATAGPTAEMSGLEKFNAGMGMGMTNIGRGLAQSVGMGPTQAETRETGARDAPLLDTGAGFAGNVAGNVAAFAPLAMVPGANTVGGAATIGALMGMAQPAGTYERLGNMAVGGALGGGMQALSQNPVAVARTVKNVVKAPYTLAKALWNTATEKGRDRILGGTLNRVAGANAVNAQQNMRNARELVPDSYPTAGEASGSAGIASLQRAVAAGDPEAYAARLDANMAARVAALEDMAGTHGARQFAQANLSSTADDLYRQARQVGLDLSKMSPARRGEITKLLRTPAIGEAMKRARVLAANEMENFANPAGSVRGLDYTARALGDMIDEAQGNNQRRILTNLRSRFLTTVDELSPEYAAARTTYSQMARPVTQMEVAQEIADKSIAPLSRQIRPESFAKQVSDKTVQRVTGMPRATLENTMTPEQLATLNNLTEDLRRYQFLMNAGRGPGSDTAQKIALSNLLAETGLPGGITKFPFVQSVSKWAFEGADDAMRQKLAETLLNPRESARLMSLNPQTAHVQLGEPSQQLRDRMALLARLLLPAEVSAESR